MQKRKSILFCGNGLSGEIIPTVKSWEYDVLAITEFPNDKGVSEARAVIEAPSREPAMALEAARQLVQQGQCFDGVISLCWDCAVSVATIAEAFGLQSVSLQTAIAATDKYIRSNAFAAAGVPSPRFTIVQSLDELESVTKSWQYPLILKPTDRSSCKGVVKVDEPYSLASAYKYAQSFTSKTEILLNEYILGTEHSTEGLMIKGKLYPTALSDRIFRYEESRPYFVEVGDIMPTALSPQQVTDMFHVTEYAARALGILNGIVKGDLVYEKLRGPMVFEIAARLGGPRFGTEMVPLSNGTNILRAAIQQALEEEINLDYLKPTFNRGMVNRSIFPLSGRVISIAGLEEVKKLPGFYDFKWWSPDGLHVGDIIAPYENSCGEVGYLIATGETREAAIKNANQIESSIHIETEAME